MEGRLPPVASSRPQKLPAYGEPGVSRGPLHRQTWDPGLWALKSELTRGPGEPVAHRTPHLLLCVGWGLTLTLTMELSSPPGAQVCTHKFSCRLRFSPSTESPACSCRGPEPGAWSLEPRAQHHVVSVTYLV